jgi:tetratricopeptide (TPR) repeat protein
LLIAGAVLCLLLAIVFFALPAWVERPETRPVEAAPVATVAVQPGLSPVQLAALREQAEALLTELLPQQDRLNARSAASWGEADWLAYQAQARLGDDAFLADGFDAAVSHYSNALAMGRELIGRAEQMIEAALIAGRDAIAAGEADQAAEQYGIVLAVEPDHARALAGFARAERLPQVLALMRSGSQARQAGDLPQARADFRAALELDPDWEPARVALGGVTTAIANARFERLLSDAFASLTAESFDDAELAFRAALVLRPDSEAALDGLEQAEQGRKLNEIALAEVRALAFERRELWEQAIERYEAALDTDSSLAFAIEGLARSRARSDLDEKLKNLIERPNLLLTEAVLSDARVLLEQARPLAEEATRIAGQVDRLDALVAAASTPIAVPFTSDALTEVTVYRFGPLGVFAETSIELKPGVYTAVGSRNGFRDVRKSFTVLPGRELQPVHVVCVEPI